MPDLDPARMQEVKVAENDMGWVEKGTGIIGQPPGRDTQIRLRPLNSPWGAAGDGPRT